MIGEGDDSGGVRENGVYISSGKKVALVLLSDLYSELDIIFVGTSRLSSYPTLYCLLTTFNLRKEYIILV